MRVHGLLAPLCLIALAACSGDPADEMPGEEATGQTSDATAEKEVVTTSSSAAQDESADGAEPQVASAAEFAKTAKAKLSGESEWRLPAVVEISGPVGNTILDEPPYAYLAFGRSPTDVDLFAEMEPRFAQQQQYGRDDFYDADGNASVMCMGPVTQLGPEEPPLVAGCAAAFRN